MSESISCYLFELERIYSFQHVCVCVCVEMQDIIIIFPDTFE